MEAIMNIANVFDVLKTDYYKHLELKTISSEELAKELKRDKDPREMEILDHNIEKQQAALDALNLALCLIADATDRKKDFENIPESKDVLNAIVKR
jgi:hypothetical protein